MMKNMLQHNATRYNMLQHVIIIWPLHVTPFGHRCGGRKGLPGPGDRYDCNHQPERMWSNTKTKLGCEAWAPNMARIPVMTLSLLSPCRDESNPLTIFSSKHPQSD